MMGLLIKDFKLLRLQKNMLFIMIVISLMFLAIGNDITFIMSYLTIIATFFVVSTISYDEYNNSNVFLLTLPITRKEYTKGKYLLGLLLCIGIWFLTTLGCTIYQIVTQPHFMFIDWLQTAVLILCIPIFALSFMLPTQLKYGGEKGRIAMVAVVGIAFVIGFAIVMLCQYLNINIDIVLNQFSNLGIVAVSVIVTVITYLISYLISLRIMKNKEF